MSFQDRIAQAGVRIATLSDDYNKNSDDHEREAEWKRTLSAILRDIASIIVEAEKANVEDLADILEKAEGAFNTAFVFAYTGELDSEANGGEDNQLFTHVPIFTDSEDHPYLQVPDEGTFSRRILRIGLSLLSFLGRTGPGGALPEGPAPWKTTLRPHPHSTKCARFKADALTVGPTDEFPNALSIFQARAEVSCGDLPNPTRLLSSPSGKLLAVLAQSGWKERIPYVSWFCPSEEPSDYLNGKNEKIALGSTAFHGAIDDQNKLVFIGDDERIKSYLWWDTEKDCYRSKLSPVHTFKSHKLDGAIGVLPNGQVARAGTGKIGLWSLDGLATHGKDVVGDVWKGEDDTWRDDPEDIERSLGAPPTAMITLSDPKYTISKWHSHPTSPGSMLSAADSEASHAFYCRVLDFESGGKISARYLGHGGGINAFSTSKGDPNIFTTACDDGYARLFDVRHSLPVMTIQPAGSPENCTGAVICHPDGLPYIFASDSEAEAINLWDIRAKATLYDLATGNNAVVGMAWNDERNELSAATRCAYVDRNGYHIDYEEARIPVERNHSDDENDDEEDRDEDEEEFEEDSDRAWPKNAYHDEQYFGHIFDSGEHRIYRYAFKVNPNPLVVPTYGDAVATGNGGGGGGFW